MRLLPLILLSGCVNWTPNEDYYYDAPLEIKENELYAVEEVDERNGTCYGTPLGTFSCAGTPEEDFEMKYNDYTVLHQLLRERYYE